MRTEKQIRERLKLLESGKDPNPTSWWMFKDRPKRIKIRIINWVLNKD